MITWTRTFVLDALSVVDGDGGLQDGILIVDWAGDWFVSAVLSDGADVEAMFADGRATCNLELRGGRVMGGVAAFDHAVGRFVSLTGISLLSGFDFDLDFEEVRASGAAGLLWDALSLKRATKGLPDGRPNSISLDKRKVPATTLHRIRL